MERRLGKLSKGCVRKMALCEENAVQARYIVQVCKVKASEGAGGAVSTAMEISDGVHCMLAATKVKVELEEFDVVMVEEYKSVLLRSTDSVAILSKLKRLFTGIDELIGIPVASGVENLQEGLICPNIPGSARFCPPESEKPKYVPVPRLDEGVMPIMALELGTQEWTIKVRVTRVSHIALRNPDSGTPTFIMLDLIDQHGTQIQARLVNDAIPKYSSIIREGECYYISRGMVKMAFGKYTSIENDHILKLDSDCRIVQTVDDGTIRHREVRYSTVQQIQAFPKGKRVSILGILVELDPERVCVMKSGEEVKSRRILVMDANKDFINVTLWRDSSSEPLKLQQIVEFQELSVGEYRGKCLCTTSETRIQRNPKYEDVAKLQAALSSSRKYEAALPDSRSPFKWAAEVDKLVLDPKREYQFELCGRIVSVDYEKQYFFHACKECRRKIVQDFCPYCKQNKGRTATYNFNILVADPTGLLQLQVFGKEGSEILKKTADEMEELRRRDQREFRQTFERLKARDYVFAVRSKSSEFVYRGGCRFKLQGSRQPQFCGLNHVLLSKLSKLLAHSTC